MWSMFRMILISFKITGNLMEMEVQYCEINQNLFLSFILNAENVKLNAAVIAKKRR